MNHVTVSAGERVATDSAPKRQRARPRIGRALERTILVALAALFAAVAIQPALFTGHDPQAQVGEPFTSPGAAHPFGTDDIGRDLYTRIIYGAGISLTAAVLAIAIGLSVGVVLGLTAGLRQGRPIDKLISRLSEAVLAVPGVLLAMAVIAAFGRGAIVVAIAVGLGQIPYFARLVRGEVIRVRALTFVEAARTSGSSGLSVVVLHIVPAISRPVAAYTLLHLSLVMLEIGGISYLGFGEPTPSPEWGALIAAGQRYIAYAWWIPLLPGLAFVAVVLVLNRLAATFSRD